MRLSKGFFPTVKEVPTDAVIPSHQLMIRAGLIRPLSAGIYSFLPLGYAVMKKVIQIIREEMDAIGGAGIPVAGAQPRRIVGRVGPGEGIRRYDVSHQEPAASTRADA